MLKYASVTNCGSREINEDSLGVKIGEKKSCFVLCDGLGGHGMGDVASGLVTQRMLTSFEEGVPLETYVRDIFLTAQEELLQEQNAKNAKSKMKTTVVCMATDEKKAYVGYIGDSRFYAFSKGKVKLQSKDHSVPYMLYLSRAIREEEIRNHPDRNMLLRVMGTPWQTPMYEVLKPFPLKKYDAFLLCSDGFWELITEKQMGELLIKSETPKEWLDAMTCVVQENGKDKEMDNFSAIAIMRSRGDK